MECCDGTHGLPYTFSLSNMDRGGTFLRYGKDDSLDENRHVFWNKAYHTPGAVFHRGWVVAFWLHHSDMTVHQILTSDRVGNNPDDTAQSTRVTHRTTFSCKATHICARYSHSIFDRTCAFRNSFSCYNAVHIDIIPCLSVCKGSPSHVLHICI